MLINPRLKKEVEQDKEEQECSWRNELLGPIKRGSRGCEEKLQAAEHKGPHRPLWGLWLLLWVEGKSSAYWAQCSDIIWLVILKDSLAAKLKIDHREARVVRQTVNISSNFPIMDSQKKSVEDKRKGNRKANPSGLGEGRNWEWNAK